MTIADRLKDLMLVFFMSCFTPQGWRPKFEKLLSDINTLETAAREQKQTIYELKRRVEECEAIINAHPLKSTDIGYFTEVREAQLKSEYGP